MEIQSTEYVSTFLQWQCLPSLLLTVPAVPQGVSATSNGSSSVVVMWMEPVVFFRE